MSQSLLSAAERTGGYAVSQSRAWNGSVEEMERGILLRDRRRLSSQAWIKSHSSGRHARMATASLVVFPSHPGRMTSAFVERPPRLRSGRFSAKPRKNVVGRRCVLDWIAIPSETDRLLVCDKIIQPIESAEAGLPHGEPRPVRRGLAPESFRRSTVGPR